MPLAAALLFVGTVGAPGWIHLGAWWGGELAGVAALYHEGSAAWLGFGCVREAFRGRGIQSALIGERLRRARDLGCAVAAAETGDWSGGRPPASMRNLFRYGFEPRYRRPDYLLTIR